VTSAWLDSAYLLALRSSGTTLGMTTLAIFDAASETRIISRARS